MGANWFVLNGRRVVTVFTRDVILAWPLSDMTYMCSLIGFNGVCEAECFDFLGSNMGGLARS